MVIVVSTVFVSSLVCILGMTFAYAIAPLRVLVGKRENVFTKQGAVKDVTFF